MRILSKAKITCTGAYVPSKKLTNYDLTKMVDTSDEWITRRTGIKERRISGDNEFASDLAIKAFEDLLVKYRGSIQDVDRIIVSTFTPDHVTPSVSALVQKHFGLPFTGAMDISMACSGFIYALCTANSFVTVGQNKKILVIASEVLSKVVDYSDRNTCVLFGDGASAFLLERTANEGGFLASNFMTDGSMADKVFCSFISNTVNGRTVQKERKIEQDGKALYEYVMKNIPEGIWNLASSSGMLLEEIDWFVPHSANIRIVKGICDRLHFPMEKTLTSIEDYGNTSSASIPLAINLALEKNRIKPGDRMLLYGFGGGLAHAGVIIEW